jgi:ATP adenylyltransferase
MTDKSHKTAISRKTLPLPTRWLLGRGLLKGVILDYGCGKCFELNNLFFVSDGYDPHYRKDGIEHSSYDTIICNFVLNVIESPAARQGVIDDIQYLLAPGGVAYISVRNDKETQRLHETRHLAGPCRASWTFDGVQTWMVYACSLQW